MSSSKSRAVFDIRVSFRKRYAVYGALIGLFFPVLGTIIDCSLVYGFFSPWHFFECQQNNPLLWIIDSAPLFLGMFASFAGMQMDRIKLKNQELNEKYVQMNLLRQMADAANKAKGDFLATMSHEIRTPLSAIIGYNNLLSEAKLPEDQASYVETITIASKNLHNIINDILDSSKLEAGMLKLEEKDFSLEQLATNVVRLCGDRAASKGLELKLHFDKSIPDWVKGDQTRLSQVLINLLGNAIKFTEKGSVELIIEELGRDKGHTSLRFTVSDTGIGIREDKLTCIFERFSQAELSTTRKFGGTGLGLHISRSLIQLHKGELKVKSSLGAGSEFSFEISLPEGKKATETLIKTESGNSSSPKPLEGIRILLAEDNDFNLILAETYLKRNGALVENAGDGKTAAEKAESQPFDVILMDIQMPVMDGKDATRRLRAAGIETAIIACSAHALKSEQEECLALGMNAYITKPFEEPELISTIKQFTVS